MRIILNDKRFFPARLSELKQILGEPRTNGFIEPFYTEERLKTICKNHNISQEFFEPEHHYWDNIGIIYYGKATSEKAVRHFELSLNHSEKLAFLVKQKKCIIYYRGTV